jgi:hypothetical protein
MTNQINKFLIPRVLNHLESKATKNNYKKLNVLILDIIQSNKSLPSDEKITLSDLSCRRLFTLMERPEAVTNDVAHQLLKVFKTNHRLSAIFSVDQTGRDLENVILTCKNDEIVRISKTVLMDSKEYFQKLFSCGMREAQADNDGHFHVNYTHYSKNTIEALKAYFYRDDEGWPKLGCIECLDLLYLSKNFCDLNLEGICFNKLTHYCKDINSKERLDAFILDCNSHSQGPTGLPDYSSYHFKAIRSYFLSQKVIGSFNESKRVLGLSILSLDQLYLDGPSGELIPIYVKNIYFPQLENNPHIDQILNSFSLLSKEDRALIHAMEINWAWLHDNYLMTLITKCIGLKAITICFNDNTPLSSFIKLSRKFSKYKIKFKYSSLNYDPLRVNISSMETVKALSELPKDVILHSKQEVFVIFENDLSTDDIVKIIQDAPFFSRLRVENKQKSSVLLKNKKIPSVQCRQQ